MLDNLDRIPVENPLALTQQLKTGERSKEIGLFEAVRAEANGFIAVIESRTFIGECIRRSVQSAFPLAVLTYSTAIELEQQGLLTSPKLILISWVEDNREASINALKILSSLLREYRSLSSLTPTTSTGEDGHLPWRKRLHPSNHGI